MICAGGVCHKQALAATAAAAAAAAAAEAAAAGGACFALLPNFIMIFTFDGAFSKSDNDVFHFIF
jgi:hypothetical protein